jgi:hypothetical protein
MSMPLDELRQMWSVILNATERHCARRDERLAAIRARALEGPTATWTVEGPDEFTLPVLPVIPA